MRVRLTNDAADDLRDIRSRIMRDDSAAAARVMRQIRSIIRIPGEYPHFGHPGIKDGTYEKAVPRTRYVVVYHISSQSPEELVVLRVLRGSQDRTKYRYN